MTTGLPEEIAPSTPPTRYAGWWRRLLAYAVDVGLLFAVGWGVGGLFIEQAVALGPRARWIGFAVAIAYFAVLNGRLGGGATLGKRLLRIRTRAGDGRPPNLAASTARAAVWLGPTLALGSLTVPLWLQFGLGVGLGLALAYLAVFHRPAGRTFHDLVAGTSVVRRDSGAFVPRPNFIHVGVALALAVAATLVGRLDILEDSLRLDPALSDLEAKLSEEAGARSVQVIQGSRRIFWIGAPSQRVASLFVAVDLEERVEDPVALFDRIAETVLLDHPPARQLDALTIELAYGADLFIAQRYEREALTGSPREWQARIDPVPALPQARVSIDAEFETLLARADRGDPQAMALVGLRYLQGSREEIAQGIGWLDLAAQAGVPGAQYALGVMMRDGGVPGATAADGFAWLSRAAEQGHSDAQFEIGRMHEYGIGTEPDLVAAIGWHRKAAKQGHPEAINELGTFLAHGKGFLQDRGQAARHYEAAADAGSPIAQFNLGVRLTNGDGVPKDLGRAAYWLYRAAMQGHAAAQYSLAWAYLQGNGVAKDPGIALRWFERAGRAGEIAGFQAGGDVHRIGAGVARNFSEAARWYQRGADAGSAQCAVQLLHLGLSTDVEIADPGQELERIRDLVDEGDPQALIVQAESYRVGYGVEADPLRAYSYVQRAALKGHPDAQTVLSQYLAAGIGARVDRKAAVRWLEEAVAQNHPRAQRILGVALYRGDFGKKNLRRSKRLLEAAAAGGDVDAQLALDKIAGPAPKYDSRQGPVRR